MLSVFIIKSGVTQNTKRECQTTKIDADETKFKNFTNLIILSTATKSLIRNANQAQKHTQTYFQYCPKMCAVIAKKLQEFRAA